jgi:hypothetical protein
MFAAEQQLEAAQGVQDTPFVTMKLTINEQHEIIVEAFQVLRVVNYSPLFQRKLVLSDGTLQTNRFRFCAREQNYDSVLRCVWSNTVYSIHVSCAVCVRA